MENKQIVFTKVNVAELLDVDYPVCGDDCVIVKTCVSTVSRGTERANITGEANVGIYCGPSVTFPRCCGYSSSGIVVEVGKDVTTLKVGDRVAMSWSLYKAYNLMHESDCTKLPDGVSLEDGSILHIGTFPMAAIRKTKLEIGESMLIMGLGILGMLGVAFAHAAGAVPLIVADPVKERRETALLFGADYAFDPFDEDFAEKVKSVTDGKGVNTAIEVTGSGKALDQCLDCMAQMGRIALLGCTRDKNFTIDYYRKVHGNGVSLIGAHTMARPKTESSAGLFTTKDDVKTECALLEHGRVDFSVIKKEVYSPVDCQQVFDRVINDRNFPIFMQFDWKKL